MIKRIGPRIEQLCDTYAIRMKELEDGPSNTVVEVYPGIGYVKRHLLHPFGFTNLNRDHLEEARLVPSDVENWQRIHRGKSVGTSRWDSEWRQFVCTSHGRGWESYCNGCHTALNLNQGAK